MPATPEIRSEIEAREAEQEQINQAHQEAEEYPPDVDVRMSEIEMRIDELNDQARQYREEEKRLAGAIVSLENHGQTVIYRGLVRSEDRKKVQAVKSDSNGQHEAGDDEGEESDDVKLSGALVEDLTAHRTAALRAMLATRPDVALVAAAHSLALRVCYESCYEVGSCLSLTSEKGGCRLDSHAKGIETSLAQMIQQKFSGLLELMALIQNDVENGLFDVAADYLGDVEHETDKLATALYGLHADCPENQQSAHDL
jgi:ParB family chromosome partitioning protein